MYADHAALAPPTPWTPTRQRARWSSIWFTCPRWLSERSNFRSPNPIRDDSVTDASLSVAEAERLATTRRLSRVSRRHTIDDSETLLHDASRRFDAPLRVVGASPVGPVGAYVRYAGALSARTPYVHGTRDLSGSRL